MRYVAQGWAEMEIKHAQQSLEKINSWKHARQNILESTKDTKLTKAMN